MHFLSPRQKFAYTGLAALFLFGLSYMGAQKLHPPTPLVIHGVSPPDGTVVVVHVAGAVKNPGVYRLPASGRVSDAVAAAGGTAEDADIAKTNLAEILRDGEQILVSRKGEPAPAASTASPGKKVPPPPGSIDLNQAGPDELQKIPGIGAATAKKIIALRTKKGKFMAIEELQEIRGLGGKRFAAISKYFRL